MERRSFPSANGGQVLILTKHWEHHYLRYGERENIIVLALSRKNEKKKE